MIILAVIIVVLVIGAYARGAKVEMNAYLFGMGLSVIAAGVTIWGVFELAEFAPNFAGHWGGKLLMGVCAVPVLLSVSYAFLYSLAEMLACSVCEFIIWCGSTLEMYTKHREEREARKAASD